MDSKNMVTKVVIIRFINNANMTIVLVVKNSLNFNHEIALQTKQAISILLWVSMTKRPRSASCNYIQFKIIR